MTSRFCTSLLLILGWFIPTTTSKTVSGEFQLSPDISGHVLGAFAVTSGSIGHVKIRLSTADESYQDHRSVRLRLFKDDHWEKYLEAPGCLQKFHHSTKSERVIFTNSSGRNEYNVEMAVENHDVERPHYYYFVVDDCSLELDAKVMVIPPKIQFNLEAWNGDSHLSADEAFLPGLYKITFVESSILALLSAYVIISKLFKDKCVHSATIWVMVSAAFGAGSSYCEILNLSIYSGSGITSNLLEALSSNFEALRDSLVALLLISVGAGWIMLSDTIPLSGSRGTEHSNGFRSPRKRSVHSILSPTFIMAAVLVTVHVLLAQWGCLANDAFDSYHDFGHLPGKLLMILRIVMGISFLMVCFARAQTCCRRSNFYILMAIVGTLWFESLPMVTFICNHLVPYYLRKLTVGTWDATLQTFSMVLLSWLVTSSQIPTDNNSLPILPTHSSRPSSPVSPRDRILLSPGNSRDRILLSPISSNRDRSISRERMLLSPINSKDRGFSGERSNSGIWVSDLKIRID